MRTASAFNTPVLPLLQTVLTASLIALLTFYAIRRCRGLDRQLTTFVGDFGGLLALFGRIHTCWSWGIG